MSMEEVITRHNKVAEEYNIQYNIDKKVVKVEVKPSAKTELLFRTKPKIPKKGTSIYDGFYIRKLDGTELVYHIESGLFVARMNNKDGKVWVDENYDEIMKRIQMVLDTEKGVLND